MADASAHVGQIIHLDGGNGLPAGNYAVLPAHYALLPGAYLITPTTATLLPGQTAHRTDGTLIVSGRFGSPFSGEFDSQYRGFVIETGAAARLRSEYNESTGSQFFANSQVDLAADAGQLLLQAQTDLTLNGMIAASAQAGRGAEVDIVANQIDIVNERSAAYTGVQLSASELNALNVDSLLLGATRTRDGDGSDLNVMASRVTVRGGAALQGPDIVLAARDTLAMESAAQITASGKSNAAVTSFNVVGDGALLRVSTAQQADVVRTSVVGTHGDLSIANGVSLIAPTSVLMDATHNFSSKANIALNGGSLNLTANKISIGDGIGAIEGAIFSNAELAAMNAGTLRLSSRSSVDFYGDVAIHNDRLELNAGSLRNMGASTAAVRADNTLQLGNAINASDSAGVGSNGNLLLSAKTVELGSANDKNTSMHLHGFSNIQLGEGGITQQLVGVGAFTLSSDGNIKVVSDRITGATGASTTLAANGSVDLSSANALTPAAYVDGLNSALAISGSSVHVSTQIVLPSGQASLTANGAATSDDVTLASGAIIDVSGKNIVFAHDSVRTDGGEVHLVSAHGNVVADSNATVRLGSATVGGNAGLLQIQARNGTTFWNAPILGAAPSDSLGGSLDVDIGNLSGMQSNNAAGNTFGDWLSRIASDLLNNSVSLRVRSGDIAIDRNIRANALNVIADGGSVTVGATVDASGDNGGSIAMYGRDSLHMTSDAHLIATATSDSGRGGSVEMGTTSGAMIFDNGASINVAGGMNGRDGKVLLREPRNVTNDGVAITNNGLSVAGAERVDLDAFKIYSASSLDAVVNQMYNDAVNFMSHEAAVKAGVGGFALSGNVHLRPEMEVKNSGGISVSSPIDLTADADFDGKIDWRFGANQEAPVFTLRAGGDLNVQASLTDGFTTIYDPNFYSLPTTILLAIDSTDLHLIAGADLQSASPYAVNANVGSLNVMNGANVVTGRGDLRMVSGGDINVTDPNSVIGSLGATRLRTYEASGLLTSLYGISGSEQLPDVGDFNAGWAYWLFQTEYQYLQFPEFGGDVSIAAKGNVSFAKTDSLFSDWLHREAGTITIRTGQTDPRTGEELVIPFNATTWGVSLEGLQPDLYSSYHDPKFQGTVALGGGNLSVIAGGNVTNLNAALPVTAKAMAGGDNNTQIVGGGNLLVTAGGDITSPRVLIDKGAAQISAIGSIGAVTPADLDAILVLSDAVISLKAGQDIKVAGVTNTTLLPLSNSQAVSIGADLFTSQNYFFTYSPSAAINVKSDVGNIVFDNNSTQIYNAFNSRYATIDQPSGPADSVFAIYPGSVSASSASGSIILGASMTLFPSSSGQMILSANDSLQFLSGSSIIMSDTPVAVLPGATNPARVLNDATDINNPLRLLIDNKSLLSTPVHQNDNSVAIIETNRGDISDPNLVIPKQVDIYSGLDIINLLIDIQHKKESDISEIAAARNIIYPLTFNSNGQLSAAARLHIDINGPGRLYLTAGHDIDLGASVGVQSLGNSNNGVLPDSGANVTVMAGINGVSALTDPVLYNAFADRYLNNSASISGSYIDWVKSGQFGGDIGGLVSVFTGKNYAGREAALSEFAKLPVLTQQAISLEAYHTTNTLHRNYASDLIDFVSFERFGGDLTVAVKGVTGINYSTNTDAAAAMALLPAAQQQQIARQAFDAIPSTARRELLLSVMYSEVRQGGIENTSGLVVDPTHDGYARSDNAIAAMFPGNAWKGDVRLVFSKIYTVDDGDINFVVPGGKIDVGLSGNFAGLQKAAGDLGIVTQRYGEINAVAGLNININQSRIFSLDGAPITLWSSHGDIDAGKGAKTALSVPPPIAVTDPNTGAVTLEYPPALSGSGIQAATNSRKTRTDRGPLLTGNNATISSDTITSRIRYSRSFGGNANAYLSAPSGVIDAGDAGIQVAGNLFLAAQKVIGADNINVGGISVGVPTTTSVAAGTLSLGDSASGVTQAATSSMNDALREASAALAEATTAFVTVDIIGVGN